MSDIAAFLARRAPCLIDATVWDDGRLPLRIACYLGDEHPPLDTINSVRCVVLRDDAVLAQRDVT